jgi:chromosomal replication initiation ATPase DnaA
MLILSRELGLTQAEISKLLCRKSVSTISAAIKRITGLIETDRAINQRYQGVLARISNY